MNAESGHATEYEPFRKRFPALTSWQNADLSSSALRRSLLPGEEPLLWRALEGGCRSLGDLLDQSETSVLRWRSVGVGKAARIADMLRTLESTLNEPSRAETLRDDSAPEGTSAEPDAQLEHLVRRLAFDFDFDAAPGARPAEDADSEAESAIEILCSWAATIGGAMSRADALKRALNASSVPRDVADALKLLGEDSVEPDPFSNLDVVLQELGLGDPRSRGILLERITALEPLGLQALGDKHNVTRERIRQLETKVRSEIVAAYPQADAMRVLGWIGHALREELGAFAPVGAAQAIAPHLDPQLVFLALYLEGYEFRASHLVVAGFELPEEHELEVDAGVVDLGDLASQLEARGVKERFVDSAIAALPGFEWVAESLVTKSRNFVDRAVIVINQHGEPMDVEELRQRAAAPTASSRGFRNRIFEDDRFVRTSRNDVALAAWGHEEYTTISEAMIASVQAGPWELDDLAEDLAERFGISPNSVRMYASAPAFRIRDGMLELRPSDDPYVPRNALASVQGLFGDPGDGRVRWNLSVDKDLLRGSGRAAPSELAAAVDLRPGGRTVLVREDLAIGFTWPLSSHTGPRIGSLKSLAESLECELGDVLNLTISCAEKALLATRIRPSEIDRPGRFKTMTGVDPEDLTTLRQVLGCRDGEVAVLVKRGDDQLADVVVQAMLRP